MKNYKKEKNFQKKIKKKKQEKTRREIKIEKNIIYGVNPVQECINQNYTFEKIYLQKKQNSQNQQPFIDYCKKKRVQFFFMEKENLDKKTNFNNHQGIVAELKKGVRKIDNLEVFLDKKNSHEKNIVVILDQITDAVNIATIIRTSVFFGCRLIILPEKNTCPIDAVVHKISSGASVIIPFYFNNNLTKTIEILKKKNFTVYGCGLTKDATEINKIDFSKNIAIIIGAEGEGIRPHILKETDHQIKINQNSSLNSLNAAIATGIILHSIHN